MSLVEEDKSVFFRSKITSRNAIFCMLFISTMATIGLCEDKDVQVPVKSPQHIIVDSYKKFSCGMPANNGIQSWSNEILVGYNKRDFLEQKGHNYTNKMQGKLLLARSLDGGLTWESEDPHNYVGDGGEITAAPMKEDCSCLRS